MNSLLDLHWARSTERIDTLKDRMPPCKVEDTSSNMDGDDVFSIRTECLVNLEALWINIDGERCMACAR